MSAVLRPSTIEEDCDPTMSLETRASSLYSNTLPNQFLFLGSGEESGVDFCFVGRFFELNDQIDNRSQHRQNAICHSSSQFASSGMTQFTAAAAPAVVGTMLSKAVRPRRKIPIGCVQNRLAVGHGMDGGHKSFHNAKLALQHFCDGARQLGSATSIGDDVLSGTVIQFVDTHAESGPSISCQAEMITFFCTTLQMQSRFASCGENTCTFQKRCSSKIAP